MVSRCITVLIVQFDRDMPGHPLLRQKLPALPVSVGHSGGQTLVPGHAPPIQGGVHPPVLVLPSEQVERPVTFPHSLHGEVVGAVVNALVLIGSQPSHGPFFLEPLTAGDDSSGHLLQLDGDQVVLLTGDGQHPVLQLPAELALVAPQSGPRHGHRLRPLVPGGQERSSVFKYFQNIFLS